MDSGLDEDVPLTPTTSTPGPDTPEPKIIDEITEYLGLKRNTAMNLEEGVDSPTSASNSTSNLQIVENGFSNEDSNITNHVEESESSEYEGFEPLPPIPTKNKKSKKKKRKKHRESDDEEYPEGIENLPQHEQFVEAQTLLVNVLNDPKKSPVKITLFKDMFNCSDCGEVFYSEEGLEDHRNRVTIQAYVKCPYCVQQPKITFNNRCRLLNHFKNHGVELSLDNLLGHINIQPLSTDPVCYDYSLSILRNMKNTYPTCTITSDGMEIDEEEPEEYPHPSFLNEEFEEEEEMDIDAPTYPGSGSPSTVPRRNGYTQKMVKCHLCDYQIPIRNLKKHQKYCDPSSEPSDFYCNVCTKVFTGNAGYLNHGRSHINSGLKICMFCYNQNIGDEDLDQHLQLHVDVINEIPYQCPLCLVSLDELVEIEAHFKAHHVVESKNRFTCAICGEHFDEVRELINHRQTHAYGLSKRNNGLDVPVPPTSRSSPNKSKERNSLLPHSHQPAKIVLTLKNKNTKPVKQNEAHNHSHKSNFTYIYTCKYCSRPPFMTCQGLRKHIKTHHPKVDFSKIQWTKMRKITKESELNFKGGVAAPVIVNGNHEESSSSSSYPKSDACPSNGTFTCLKCNDIEFDSETSFFDHVKLCHVWPTGIDENPNFWCPECGGEYMAQTSLKMHLQSEHPFIRNVNKYLGNIGYGNQSSAFKKPLQKNQCPVCRLQCTSSEYDNHLSTHGMTHIKHEVDTE